LLWHTSSEEGQSFKLKVGYDDSRYLTVRIETVSTEAQHATLIQQDANICFVMFEEISICTGDNLANLPKIVVANNSDELDLDEL
jgi:hypothetical protein